MGGKEVTLLGRSTLYHQLDRGGVQVVRPRCYRNRGRGPFQSVELDRGGIGVNPVIRTGLGVAGEGTRIGGLGESRTNDSFEENLIGVDLNRAILKESSRARRNSGIIEVCCCVKSRVVGGASRCAE